MREVDYLTGRDLELIQVALESAIEAVSDVSLREEYEHAWDAVMILQDEGAR